MRIIAGTLGGRQFSSPNTNRTHPMSDKMRGALFNILGDIAGLSVLDAFGGTGALSFEAVSRGASLAVVLESDASAQRTIAENIATLGLQEQVQLMHTAAGVWLQNNYDETYDLILCDPPYDDLQPNLLAKLARRINSRGLLVLSFPANVQAPIFDGLEQIKQQTYGDAQLLFYRKIS